MSYVFPRQYYDACVAKAVIHFDSFEPDWHKGINITSLRQGCGWTCVVAQLTGKNWKILAPHLGLYEESQHKEFGLIHALPLDASEEDISEYYWQATCAWKRVIMARLNLPLGGDDTLKTAA